MKRCPQCNRTEADDALVYCRVDGTALVSASGEISKQGRGRDLAKRIGLPELK